MGEEKGRLRIKYVIASSWFEGPNPAMGLRILNLTAFFYHVLLEFIKKHNVKNLDKDESGI